MKFKNKIRITSALIGSLVIAISAIQFYENFKYLTTANKISHYIIIANNQPRNLIFPSWQIMLESARYVPYTNYADYSTTYYTLSNDIISLWTPLIVGIAIIIGLPLLVNAIEKRYNKET